MPKRQFFLHFYRTSVIVNRYLLLSAQPANEQTNYINRHGFTDVDWMVSSQSHAVLWSLLLRSKSITQVYDYSHPRAAKTKLRSAYSRAKYAFDPQFFNCGGPAGGVWNRPPD